MNIFVSTMIAFLPGIGFASGLDSKSRVDDGIRQFEYSVRDQGAGSCESMLKVQSVIQDTLLKSFLSDLDDPRMREIFTKAWNDESQESVKEEQTKVHKERESTRKRLQGMIQQNQPYPGSQYTTREAIAYDLEIYLADDLLRLEKNAAVNREMNSIGHTMTTWYGNGQATGDTGRANRYIEVVRENRNLIMGGTDDPSFLAFKRFSESILTPDVQQAMIFKNLHETQLLLAQLKKQNFRFFEYLYYKLRPLAKSDEDLLPRHYW